MPQPKNKNFEKAINSTPSSPAPREERGMRGRSGVKIKEAESSLEEFVKRDLPSDKDAEKFEDFAVKEAREKEMEASLAEIYQDGGGGTDNVKKLDVKKGRGFLFWLFSSILGIVLLAGAVYAAYYFYLRLGSDAQAISLTVDGKSEVLADEEFYYTVGYRNLGAVDIKNVEIKFTYPEGFILTESSLAPAGDGSVWKLGDLAAHRGSEITVKGKIIGQKGEKKIALATMVYTPANFSSEFKKEAAFETIISDVGVDFSFAGNSSILVSEENEIVVKYKKQDNSFISNFRLTAEAADNVEFAKAEGDSVAGVWENNEVAAEGKEISVKFKFKEKRADTEELVLNFWHNNDGKNFYKFFEARINLEIVKNNLNLNLIINGSRNDIGVDFGQTLNYSVVYANKGEAEMKDVIIMAVLESNSLDWTSLADKNNGKVSGNAISWSKQEIPALASLKQNDEGIIDFSIKLMPFDKAAVGGELDLSRKYQVASYAQFSIGELPAADGLAGGEDRRSNSIISRINSDLKLKESIKYFNDDNIAVGSGPLPPRVGQTSSFKIYWTLTNNLHELSGLRVETELPSYVSWDDKNRAAVGSLNYDSAAHKVVWDIGRLPITVYETAAEFSISITPSEADKNKIMVLLNGTAVRAVDSETQSSIEKIMPAKTTKLEDDEIAGGSGIVE